MVLDPIRPNQTIAAAAQVAARVTGGVRSQAEKPSTPVARPTPPAPLPTPETQDEVNVKWDRSDGVIVTFTDKKSGDIVRQIPSEQVLSVARFIRRLLEEQDPGNLREARTGSDGNG